MAETHSAGSNDRDGRFLNFIRFLSPDKLFLVLTLNMLWPELSPTLDFLRHSSNVAEFCARYFS